MRGSSEALRADVYGTNLHASLIVAGEVDTEYFDRNPGVRERIPTLGKWYPKLSAEQVALAIARAIERNSMTMVIPRPLALTLFLQRFPPRPIEYLVCRTGWNRKKAALDGFTPSGG